MTKTDNGLPSLKAPARKTTVQPNISTLSSRKIDDILKADKQKTQRALYPTARLEEGYSKKPSQSSWAR